jgi:3-deoxy-D-manno-octulosonic-acid transferase
MTGLYRIIYFIVVRLLLPVLHSANSKVSRGYKHRLKKNGIYPWLIPPAGTRPLWIHCASGEFEYALPVIREIKKQAPEQKILVSYFTPTYADRMKAEPLVDFVVPSPWDEPSVIKEFIAHHQPKALLFARTDVWFEMSRQCHKYNIPVIVFSMTFQKKINLMLQTFLRWRWQFVDQFWVVSPADSDPLKALLPLASVHTVGDSRYDQCLYRLSLNKKIPFAIEPNTLITKTILAGSIWPEDEAVLVPTIAQLKLPTKSFRWILVPHETTESHLAQLEKRLTENNLEFVRASQITSWNGSQVLIVDKVGFLAELYRHADMSFIGGSFRKQVHSVMESLACGCLTFVGPFYKNNREAMEFLSPEQIIHSTQELVEGLQRGSTSWSNEQREHLAARVLQKSGSSHRITSQILKIIAESK